MEFGRVTDGPLGQYPRPYRLAALRCGSLLFLIAMCACGGNGSSGRPAATRSDTGRTYLRVDSLRDERFLTDRVGDNPQAKCTVVGSVDSLVLSRFTPHGGGGIYGLRVYFSGMQLLHMHHALGTIRADTAVIDMVPGEIFDERPGGAMRQEENQDYQMSADNLRAIARAASVRMRIDGPEGRCEWQLGYADMNRFRIFVRDEVADE
jgi:hypothetical protein